MDALQDIKRMLEIVTEHIVKPEDKPREAAPTDLSVEARAIVAGMIRDALEDYVLRMEFEDMKEDVLTKDDLESEDYVTTWTLHEEIADVQRECVSDDQFADWQANEFEDRLKAYVTKEEFARWLRNPVVEGWVQ